MKSLTIRISTAGALAAVLMLPLSGGCDEEPPMMMPMDDAGPPALMCTGSTLCDRSLGECGVTTITRADCDSFYAPATSSCSNVAAYTACNCTCSDNNAISCVDWFTCGETCFSTHCM